MYTFYEYLNSIVGPDYIDDEPFCPFCCAYCDLDKNPDTCSKCCWGEESYDEYLNEEIKKSSE